MLETQPPSHWERDFIALQRAVSLRRLLSDANPHTGLVVTFVATALTCCLSWWLFRIGYKIKF